jgi:3-mercaptopyruvate sulfurtransferase SseA
VKTEERKRAVRRTFSLLVASRRNDVHALTRQVLAQNLRRGQIRPPNSSRNRHRNDLNAVVVSPHQRRNENVLSDVAGATENTVVAQCRSGSNAGKAQVVRQSSDDTSDLAQEEPGSADSTGVS